MCANYICLFICFATKCFDISDSCLTGGEGTLGENTIKARSEQVAARLGRRVRGYGWQYLQQEDLHRPAAPRPDIEL
jgi:hypothetical protein